MSYELDIKCKKKTETFKDGIDLITIPLSCCEGLTDNVHLHFSSPNEKADLEYENYHVMNRDKIKEIIGYYIAHITNLQYKKIRLANESDKLLGLLPKTVDDDAYDRIEDDRADCLQEIDEVDDSINNCNKLKHLFEFIQKILEDNNNDGVPVEIIYSI